MNDENKTNENKFQEMLQLAEFGAKRIEERRSVEFRIFISYITLLVLALYQLIKQDNPIHDFFQLVKQKDSISLELWEGLTLYVSALLIHVIYVIWQVGIGIAMDNDSYRRNFYLKKAEGISGHPLEYDCKNPNSDRKIVILKHYFQQFLHLKVIWTDWSRLLLVGIPTILFIIIVDLSIKDFNLDISICYHILLLVMPALILLVSVVVWIVAEIKASQNHNASS